jgi:hypothetical protein
MITFIEKKVHFSKTNILTQNGILPINGFKTFSKIALKKSGLKM